MTTSMVDTSGNDFSKISTDNIILSYVAKNIKPRYILGDSTFPISIEVSEAKTPFGIDNIYGKHYMKLIITDRVTLAVLHKIEERLKILVAEKEGKELETILSNGNIQTVLDKNIEIINHDGTHTTMFAIDKGTFFTGVSLTWMVQRITIKR
jgi:hypothetical protein